MGFNCGVVGLPNVGKSTIFNALTAAGAQAENFPFCTIEPNIGVVAVPDDRLARLAGMSRSEKILPTSLDIVDIAGLVKGASEGEGLGNQFLGHIKQVDAIAHVVRCFEDDNITHVAGAIDPVADIEVIETELLLADLATVAKRITQTGKRAKTGDKDVAKALDRYKSLEAKLSEGVSARKVIGDDPEFYKDLFLITAKPIVYVCNISEDQIGEETDKIKAVRRIAEDEGAPVVVICGGIEAELSVMDADDKTEFLADYGLSEPGLNSFIRTGYELLNLITYFTTGPKETRAWTVTKGSKAPQAAGVIHTDFERGFIKAEVISFDDLDRLGSEAAVKDAGLLRIEGKEYIFHDGDVAHFRFNV